MNKEKRKERRAKRRKKEEIKVSELINPNNEERIAEKRKVLKKSKKLHDANYKIKLLRKSLVFMLGFLVIIYLVLRIVYQTGRFTVVLDSSSDMKGALVMYASKDNKLTRRTLVADSLEFMTNISEQWLPENIDEEAEGSHNGDNYIAYTFYLENEGDEQIDYWYKIVIDDVIKNVDKAIRVAMYLNGNKTVYAKLNSTTSKPEMGTVAFKDDETVMLEKRENFNSGDVDKCTIVIWIEGDDPECIDDLIGGEMKMHMVITEEHKEQK